MTSWIVSIAGNYAQHWHIAARHGFWDMTKKKQIEAGDDVYFWLSGSSLLSRVHVTSGTAPIQAQDSLPWEDSGQRNYTHRFLFEVVSEEPALQPTWTELKAETGITASPHFGPNRVPELDGERWLATIFSGAPLPERFLPDDLRDRADEMMGTDLRERTLRKIALRQGQPQFRRKLLTAYDGACAVTGSSVERVLEAAHISPYLGPHTNTVTNGLLLRADIHTLYDVDLLAITPDLRVRVAPELHTTAYGEHDGQPLRTPDDSASRPQARWLQEQCDRCAWLGRL